MLDSLYSLFGFTYDNLFGKFNNSNNDKSSTFEFFLTHTGILKSASEDLEKTIKILFYIGDVEELNKKEQFMDLYVKLYNSSQKAKNELLSSVWAIIECRGWDGLVELYTRIDDQEFKDELIDLIESQLLEDSIDVDDISDCAKHFPTENSSIDKKYHIFTHLSRYMRLTKKELRTRYITPLREVIRNQNNNQQIEYNLVKTYFNKPLFAISQTEYEFNLLLEEFGSWNDKNIAIVLDIQEQNYCLAVLMSILFTANLSNVFKGLVIRGDRILDLNNKETLHSKFLHIHNTRTSGKLQHSFDLVRRRSILKHIRTPTIMVISDSQDQSVDLKEFDEHPRIIHWDVSKKGIKIYKQNHKKVRFIEGYSELLLSMLSQSKPITLRSVYNEVTSDPEDSDSETE